MSREIWDSLLTEKGFMQVPRALRLKRSELGLTNNEYTILLDYVDYYTYSRSVNPYRHLSEVNGVSERSIRNTLSALEKKGFLKREVRKDGNGRTKGVVFSLVPLVKKLKAAVGKTSPAVEEEKLPHVPEDSFPPNTREELSNKEEGNNKQSAEHADAGGVQVSGHGQVDGEEKLKMCSRKYGSIGDSGGRSRKTARGNGRPGGKAHHNPDAPAIGRQDRPHGPGVLIPAGGDEGAEAGGDSPEVKEKKWKDPYCAARWYNEVFAVMYREAAGQPVLTGGREYKSAETYFRRLRELNPEMSGEEVFRRATDAALFMIASQMEGGVFAWIHKPPDICMLASQAQSVDYHLRKQQPEGEAGLSDGEGETGGESVRLSFIEKIREGEYASQKITRIYDELSGIERVLRSRRAARGDEGRARQSGPGDNAPEQKAIAGSPQLPRKRRGR